MKQKFEIWKSSDDGHDDNRFGRLVDFYDIITAVDCSQFMTYRFGIGITEQQVKDAYAARDLEEYEDCDLSDWLQDDPEGLVDDKPDYLDVSDERLCYDSSNNFFVAKYCDGFRMLDVWDGHNQVKIYAPDEDGEVIEVEYDPEDTYNLDKLNFGNYDSGTTGKHHEEIELEDGSVIVIHTSQWQGDFTTAEVMTKEEFAGYCKEYDIDNPYK